jgi:hypothetical protein
MSPAQLEVLVLSIHESAGPVTRISLLGYQVGDGGEVVELQEVLQRLQFGGAPAAPAPPADDGGEPQAPELVVELDGHEACEDGSPCAPCAEAFAVEVDAQMEEDCEPSLAQVKPCLECSRGAKRVRCGFCLGRGLRAWVRGREVVNIPMRTDEDRLGLGLAVVDSFPLKPEQIEGARLLLEKALVDGPEWIRKRVLKEWMRRLHQVGTAA